MQLEHQKCTRVQKYSQSELYKLTISIVILAFKAQ